MTLWEASRECCREAEIEKEEKERLKKREIEAEERRGSE